MLYFSLFMASIVVMKVEITSSSLPSSEPSRVAVNCGSTSSTSKTTTGSSGKNSMHSLFLGYGYTPILYIPFLSPQINEVSAMPLPLNATFNSFPEPSDDLNKAPFAPEGSSSTVNFAYQFS